MHNVEQYVNIAFVRINGICCEKRNKNKERKNMNDGICQIHQHQSSFIIIIVVGRHLSRI